MYEQLFNDFELIHPNLVEEVFGLIKKAGEYTKVLGVGASFYEALCGEPAQNSSLDVPQVQELNSTDLIFREGRDIVCSAALNKAFVRYDLSNGLRIREKSSRLAIREAALIYALARFCAHLYFKAHKKDLLELNSLLCDDLQLLFAHALLMPRRYVEDHCLNRPSPADMEILTQWLGLPPQAVSAQQELYGRLARLQSEDANLKTL